MSEAPQPEHDNRREAMVLADHERRAAAARRTRRTRIAWIVAAWVIATPLSVVMWAWFGWVALLLVAAMLWATWDYYRRGDMLASIEATQRAGAFLPGSFHGDDRRG